MVRLLKGVGSVEEIITQTSFLELEDTPSTYGSIGNALLKVNGSANGIEVTDVTISNNNFNYTAGGSFKWNSGGLPIFVYYGDGLQTNKDFYMYSSILDDEPTPHNTNKLRFNASYSTGLNATALKELNFYMPSDAATPFFIGGEGTSEFVGDAAQIALYSTLNFAPYGGTSLGSYAWNIAGNEAFGFGAYYWDGEYWLENYGHAGSNLFLGTGDELYLLGTSGIHLGDYGVDWAVLTGTSLDILNKKIVNLTTPTNPNDAANKTYVDTEVSSVSTNLTSHTSDATIHFTEASIDHGSITGLGDDDHTQYHNIARADTWLGTKTTTELAEGTNLYYTDARADARITLQKGQANGIATLGADTKIPTSQLPALAITDTFVVASEVEQLALTIQTGDVVVRTDLSKSYINTTGNNTAMTDWQELLTPDDAVQSVNGLTGNVTLTTTEISEGTNLYFTDLRAQTALNSHTSDSTIHYTEGSISHLNITNIGTNTHAQIDSHIADTTLHFLKSDINLGDLGNTTITTPTADQMLIFNGTDWVNQNYSGAAWNIKSIETTNRLIPTNRDQNVAIVDTTSDLKRLEIEPDTLSIRDDDGGGTWTSSLYDVSASKSSGVFIVYGMNSALNTEHFYYGDCKISQYQGDFYIKDTINNLELFRTGVNNTKQTFKTKNLELEAIELELDDDQSIYFDTTNTKTLSWNSTNARFEFNDDVNITGNIEADTGHIGDATNYTEIQTDGSIVLHGTARKYKEVQTYAYNIYGSAATYNGVSCQAAGTVILDNKFISKSFDSGASAGTAEAAIASFKLPEDYDAGTDIKVNIAWTSVETTGNVIFGIGLLAVGDGEQFNGTETYQIGTEAAPTTSYQKVSTEVTFSGTGMEAGDDVSIIVYRDADNANDTMAGDALMTTLSLKYISNTHGGNL